MIIDINYHWDPSSLFLFKRDAALALCYEISCCDSEFIK